MKLYGNDIIQVSTEFVEEVALEVVSLDRLLKHSDFVSLNCDLNPSSVYLLDEAAFRLMRPGSILINTSRGAVVNESALIAALESGSIAGAGLDVFEDEPLPLESPLRQMDNVLLAPHNANSSPEAWRRVHLNTIRNLFNALSIDLPEQLYQR
jgi:D-3-phosphoglycerate dehydrogenase